jgi:hypothetical protein
MSRSLRVVLLTGVLTAAMSMGGSAQQPVTVIQNGNQAQVNGSGQLSTVCANCSGSGVSQIDNTGFVPGTTVFVPLGGEVDDTGTTAVSENSAGAARITPQRGLHINLRNNAGTEVGTSGAPLRFDPTGATTQPISASSLPLPTGASTSANQTTEITSLQIIDDPVVTLGTTTYTEGTTRAFMIGCVRRDANTTMVDTTNEAGPCALDAAGNLKVNVVAGGASGGTSTTDDSPFAVGSGAYTPIGGTYKATRDAVDDNDGGAFAMNAKRGVYTTLETPNADSAMDETANAVRNINVDATGAVLAPSVDADHGSAVKASGPQYMVEAKDFDGSALPNAVTEGQAIRPAATMSGVQYQMLVNEDGSGIGSVILGTGANVVGFVSHAATATTTNSALECAIVSTATTNSTNCKGSVANFYGIDVYNTTTTTYYLRMYNTASAPTCSSATGFVRSFPIPPASASGQTGGVVRITDVAVGYGMGLSYCLTAGGSSTDNTAAATGIYGAISFK